MKDGLLYNNGVKIRYRKIKVQYVFFKMYLVGKNLLQRKKDKHVVITFEKGY